MRVFKWGNGLAIRLRQDVIDALGVSAGDEVEIRTGEGRTLVMEKKPTPKELLEQLRKYRGMLPADFVWDREEANRRFN